MMTHYSIVGELPRHIYCYVDSRFTHQNEIGFIPCVWFGLVSYPGRVWGCTVMLENGAIYRNVPVHGVAFMDKPCEWDVKDAQTWDCYGSDFTTVEYRYLARLDCKVRANGREHEGHYLFSVAPINDGFSAYPEQAKEFCFVRLDNSRLSIQPTNLVVFRELSFTSDKLEFPTGMKRQDEVWSAE